MMTLKPLLFLLLVASATFADELKFADSPASYPAIRSDLLTEFATAAFPPLRETTLSYYQVPSSGPVDVEFRFQADTGAFLFNFGFYRHSSALDAIDTSTDVGKVSYATQALAPGNATVVFDDRVDNPGRVKSFTLTGGDVLGFFLIPDASLSQFQDSPSLFDVNGTGSVALGAPGATRWPLFGLANANAGGLDQLMSFDGVATSSGNASNLFAWEDLTRAQIAGNLLPSDVNFHDLVFNVEGVVATIPEPSSLILVLTAMAFVGRRFVNRSTCRSA